MMTEAPATTPLLDAFTLPAAGERAGRRRQQRPDGAASFAGAFAAVALAIGLLTATPPVVAAPACLLDTSGADDINANQKDLNEFCQGAGNDGGLSGCLSSDANLTWTWDDTGWAGSNTGDACPQFDTDADGKATVAPSPDVPGGRTPQDAQSPQVYTCDQTK